jgi:hypothetical protein
MKKTLLLVCFLVSQLLLFAQQIPLEKAKSDITAKASKIGLSGKQISNFIVSSAFSDNEISYYYLQQTINNISIRNQIKVVAFKNGEVINNTGEFLPDEITASKTNSQPTVTAIAATKKAFEEAKIQAPNIVSSKNGTKNNFGVLAGVYEEVTTNLEWYVVEKNGKFENLSLAWAVVVAPNGTDDIWQYIVDANTGSVLNKYNYTIHEHEKQTNNISVGVLENKTTKNKISTLNLNLPKVSASPNIVANANYFVSPWPAESPSHTGGAPASRSNPWAGAGTAGTLGWHSNGTTDYQITRGNNVWATEDVSGSNTNSGQPAVSSTSPDPLNFIFPANFNANPKSSQFQPFAITNLFYWNNIIHDITHIYGFNEANGNFQANNQGRGGNGGDDVIALAQSGGSGCVGNNANMATPPDGGRPRMRMYLWTGLQGPVVQLGATNFNAVEGNFSNANQLACNTNTVTGQLIYYNDATGGTHQACGPGTSPSNSITGKIVLIDRGNCNFTEKVQNAQNAGALAVIIVNNVAGAPIIMGGGPINTITIPAIMVTDVDGAALIAAAASNQTVNITPPISLDSDLDNGVIAHEYTHGISNRLTGGPATTSCLQNAEQAGEGWSDYFALMLCTNWATAQLTDGTIPRPIGTYANAQTPTGSGIRNFPYSTNLATNPLTYANMGVAPINSTVHGIGEIWCSAVWDMTWGIIQQEGAINTNLYNFSPTTNGGNSIAFKLVMEGMRLQPCSPGFVDMRNAILAADRNLYAGTHACAIWTAFAKRGLGFDAAQGSSNSAIDQVSSTTLPPAPTMAMQPVDVTVASGANATFSADAGANVNLIYRWQVSTNNGTSWANVVPAIITPTLTLNAVTPAMNNNKYRCIVSIGCATTTSSVATLNVTGGATPPVITTQPTSVTACVNANATFTAAASGTGVTYNWEVSTNNGTSWASVTPANTTTTLTLTAVTTAMNNNQYRIVATNATGSVNSNAAILTVQNTPAPTVTTPVTYCQGATATALSATGTSLLWYGTNATGGTGSTTATVPSTTASGSTTYYVTQTVSGCESPRAAIVVNVTASPTAPTVTSPVTYCQNTAAVPLTAAGTNLLWYGTNATGGTGSATAPTPSTTTLGNTIYYVSQSASGCESPRAAITVSIVASTPAPTVTSPVTYCQGATAVALSATGTNLLWYGTNATGGTGSATAPTPSTATLGNTVYYVSQTTSCGEGPRAAITVTVNAVPASPTVTSPITYCQGATAVALSATGTNLLWYGTNATGGTGSTTATIPSTATVGSVTYYVSQSAASGCESPRAAIVVNINATPAAPTATSPIAYCQGATATALTATGTNLLWYGTNATGGTGSATATVPSTTAAGSTTYYVSQSANGCESPRTAIVVNVTALPAAPTVSTPVVYCQNTTATALTATGTNLKWYTVALGGTSSTTAPIPSTTTLGTINYYVSQTVGTCEGPRALIAVNVVAQIAAPTVISPIAYCQGATATALTASGTGLLWYGTNATGGTGSTTAPIPSTATVGSTTYYVSQTASCESPRAAIVVNINVTPAAPTVTSPVSYCQGNTATVLTATGTNLLWYAAPTGGTGSTTAPTPLTTTAGTFNFYVSQTTGTCEGPRANIVVNVGSAPTITTQPVDITSCTTTATFTAVASGTSLTYQWQLSTDGGATYTNIAGANASSYTISGLTPAQANNKYRLVVSSATCPVATSNAVIAKIGSNPVVVLTASPTFSFNPYTNGGVFTTVSPSPSTNSYTYQWKRNGGIITNVTPSITKANGLLDDFGTYEVTVTDNATGCKGVSNLITINDIESERDKLFIYPNPSVGMIRVSYYSATNTAQARTIAVYDSKGAQLMFKNVTMTGRYGFAEIDLSKFVKGTYAVVLLDANGKKVASEKVVKY